MRQLGLRWGLIYGVAGAVLGVLALLLGNFFAPIPTYSTAEEEVAAVFVQGMLTLVALGVVFGMAYFAGLRTERDKLARAGTEAVPALETPEDRSGAIFAGGLVMLCYWFVTTLYLWLQPTVAPSVNTPRPDVQQFLVSRLIFGVVCIVFGVGLGGLGGRAPAARRLLDRIAVTPVAAPVVAVSIPAATASIQPAAPEPSESGESAPSATDDASAQ